MHRDPTQSNSLFMVSVGYHEESRPCWYIHSQHLSMLGKFPTLPSSLFPCAFKVYDHRNGMDMGVGNREEGRVGNLQPPFQGGCAPLHQAVPLRSVNSPLSASVSSLESGSPIRYTTTEGRSVLENWELTERRALAFRVRSPPMEGILCYQEDICSSLTTTNYIHVEQISSW